MSLLHAYVLEQNNRTEICLIQGFLIFGHKVRYPHFYPRRLTWSQHWILQASQLYSTIARIGISLTIPIVTQYSAPKILEQKREPSQKGYRNHERSTNTCWCQYCTQLAILIRNDWTNIILAGLCWNGAEIGHCLSRENYWLASQSISSLQWLAKPGEIQWSGAGTTDVMEWTHLNLFQINQGHCRWPSMCAWANQDNQDHV